MRVTWPSQIPSGTAASADLPFLCSVSEIPASTIGNIPVPYFGRKLNYAGDRTFEPLTITVLNDEDFKIRKALEAWLKAITDHSTTVSQFNGGIVSGSYATDAEVRQYSRNDNGQGGVPLQAYRFVGLFPVNLGAIALDWNSSDQIETFTCQFQYQWWEAVNATSGVAL
jgi:hypothetical protein